MTFELNDRIPSSYSVAPRVELREGVLHYSIDPQSLSLFSASYGGSASAVTADSLQAFIDADDAEQVATFADRHGPLDVCPHAVPQRYQGPLPRSLGGAGSVVADHVACGGGMLADETVDAWRYWIEQARLLRALTGSAHDRRKPSQARWDALWRAAPWASTLPGVDRLTVGDEQARMMFEQAPDYLLRNRVASALNRWLAMAGGERATVTWGRRVEIVTRRGEGLLARLGWQLVIEAAGAEAWASCDRCRIEVPMLRGRAGERRFCPTCRAAGWPVRLAARDSRARKRARKSNA